MFLGCRFVHTLACFQYWRSLPVILVTSSAIFSLDSVTAWRKFRRANSVLTAYLYYALHFSICPCRHRKEAWWLYQPSLNHANLKGGFLSRQMLRYFRMNFSANETYACVAAGLDTGTDNPPLQDMGPKLPHQAPMHMYIRIYIYIYVYIYVI